MSNEEESKTFSVNLLGSTPKEQWVTGMIAYVNAIIVLTENSGSSAAIDARNELVRCIKAMGEAAEEAGVWDECKTTVEETD